MPKDDVSIIWINYNSMDVLDTVVKSLRSIFEAASFAKQSLTVNAILVDNGSVDGSWEVILKRAQRYSKNYRVDLIPVRLSRNYLYAGGVNAGLSVIRNVLGGTDFVVFANNDFIAKRDVLSKLIRYFYRIDDAGGIQGVIFRRTLEGVGVESCGWYVTDLLNPYPLRKIPEYMIPVTYVYGAFSVYRFDLLTLLAWDSNKCWVLHQCAPAYMDDIYLGIRAWDSGSCMYAVSVVSGIHQHNLTFGRYNRLRLVNLLRSWLVLRSILEMDQLHETILEFYRARLILKYLRYLGVKGVNAVINEAKHCSEKVLERLGRKIRWESIPKVKFSYGYLISLILGSLRLESIRVEKYLEELTSRDVIAAVKGKY